MSMVYQKKIIKLQSIKSFKTITKRGVFHHFWFYLKYSLKPTLSSSSSICKTLGGAYFTHWYHSWFWNDLRTFNTLILKAQVVLHILLLNILKHILLSYIAVIWRDQLIHIVQENLVSRWNSSLVQLNMAAFTELLLVGMEKGKAVNMHCTRVYGSSRVTSYSHL